MQNYVQFSKMIETNNAIMILQDKISATWLYLEMLVMCSVAKSVFASGSLFFEAEFS